MSAVTAIFLDPAERYGRVYIYRNSFITLLSMTQLSTIKIIIISYLNCDNLFKNGNRILGISAKYMTACMQTTDDSNILLESKKENKFLLFYYSVKCPSIKCMEFSFELVLWVLSQLIHYLIKVSLQILQILYRYIVQCIFNHLILKTRCI